jgi:asparagine synthase (glutamine-hydrolysing)
MLKRARDDAATFTIGFDAEGYDESGYARLAANHFGTRHHEYFVTPQDVSDALPLIARHLGEPFGNSSVVPAYYCARFARQHGVSLMLAGDGGDELFAGNSRYLDQKVFEAWFRVPAPLRAALKGGYRLLPFLERLPVAGKGARYIAQAEMGLPDRLQSYNFLHRFSPASVFSASWLAGVDQSEPWTLWRERYAASPTSETLQRMLYLDWKFTLADNDLVKVSQMCDLAGVEVTYPLLDERVVEFACRIPPSGLLRGNTLRSFYKRAAQDFLPDTIINKSKHGFGLPFGVWMQRDEGLRTLAADTLRDLRKREVFDATFLLDVEKLHQQGAAGYYGELVWILSMLELWLATHEGSYVSAAH